ALAVNAAKGEEPVASTTLLAAMLDFSETGQIGLFVDEASVAAREAAIGKSGILAGAELAFVFSSLRANDLIWPYVVNNYLLGGEDKTFVLGASGHIAGVVNPASKHRRSHWTGTPYPQDPDAWLAHAKEHKGSWWPRWSKWLAQHDGGRRKAPARTGNMKHKP